MYRYFGDLLYDYGLQTKVDPKSQFCDHVKNTCFPLHQLIWLGRSPFYRHGMFVLLKYELGIRKCDIFESLGEIKCKHIICGVCSTCALFW